MLKNPGKHFFAVSLIAGVILGSGSLSSALADSREVTGDYNGKTACQNGLKKAGFKASDTGKVTYFSANEIAKEVQALSYPDSSNGMSFDTREKTKTQLQHVLKVLKELDCDTADKAAQSDGIQAGMNTGTKDGTSANSYVQPPR